jgi:myo-inositol-1-phosphate synthase
LTSVDDTNEYRLFNVCEDSLLASPLIIDLVIVAEMMTRISYKATSSDGSASKEYKGFHSVLSILSYMLKVCDRFAYHNVSRLIEYRHLLLLLELQSSMPLPSNVVLSPTSSVPVLASSPSLT